MVRRGSFPEIENLRSLEEEEQITYALTLLDKRPNKQVLKVALELLGNAQEPSRQIAYALHEVYRYYDEDGPTRDPASPIRSEVIRALTAHATISDLSLLEKAAQTYERIPPAFFEEAGMLRAAALTVIADLEPHLARYYAHTMLGETPNTHSAKMSGEPALTAVRVLAAFGEIHSLFGYVMRSSDLVSEAVSEALRKLVKLPESLLPLLVERYDNNVDDMILAGLTDLILDHSAGHLYHNYILKFLSDTESTSLYRYLLTRLLFANNQELKDQVFDVIGVEQDPNQILIILDVLTLLPDSETVDSTVRKLTGRL